MKKVSKSVQSFLLALILLVTAGEAFSADISAKTREVLKGKQILYVERFQFPADHHNTATLFQTGEINTYKFAGGSAMKIYDVDNDSSVTILESSNGIIRDPEISYNGKKVIFSMRNDINDDYHIYEIGIDGKGLRQLTFGSTTSDIDPVYLPNGDILFSATRQPKYCMCNRHIMCNLYRMRPDGSGITQLGYNTLFDGHSTVMENGLILYDRWEYVDRNFGDAQGLWTVNPDGTKHAIYYGNNTSAPGGAVDARQIPGTDLVVCVFGSCHDRPWGALAVIDRKKGIDGAAPVQFIYPESSRAYITEGVDDYNVNTGYPGYYDAFSQTDQRIEDPYPIDSNNFLVSQTNDFTTPDGQVVKRAQSTISLISTDGRNEVIIKGQKSLFDPMIVQSRKKPMMIPTMRDDSKTTGIFYVQNVYEGTHMNGVEPGSIKYLRVVETPPKRTWSERGWGGQGEQAPGVNWSNFEVKRIIGEVEVNKDGSVCFEAPAEKFIYFQLLDADKKMVQSMRSGTMLVPGEINGCIGCHEDRLSVPLNTAAIKFKPKKLEMWNGEEPRNFSYLERVQPIFDKHCVECHDFNPEKRGSLVLAADKNMFFNASYISLYMKGDLKEPGGGAAKIQPALSWGSNASKLAKIISKEHRGVTLSKEEREMIYTWIDLNGVYYPTYETSFDSNLAGRSPLNNDETNQLGALTGVDFGALNSCRRSVPVQVSFDRPEKSPCLDAIRDNKEKFDQAVEIIKTGAQRLKDNPRGDIESELKVHPRLQHQLDHYFEIMGQREIAGKK